MATTTPHLQNLAVEWGLPGQEAIIADLVKTSGILQTALVRPSNYGNKHKYKIWNSLPSSAFRALGAGIVPSIISKDRAAIDLWDLSSLMEEDAAEILAHPGGKQGWFNANIPAFLEGIGQTAAKQIIYGTDPTFGNTNGFLGFHQYAKNNSKVVAQKGETTAGRTTIFAVRWDETNGASIRINPQDSGNLINVTDITPTDPQLVVTNTTTNAQLPVFAWWLHAFMTLVVPSAVSVAAITQVGPGQEPSSTDLNALLDAVESPSGQTYIYCNNQGYNAIETLKYDKLSLFSETTNYNSFLSSWRGVPIIKDNNIVSTETTDLD